MKKWTQLIAPCALIAMGGCAGWSGMRYVSELPADKRPARERLRSAYLGSLRAAVTSGDVAAVVCCKSLKKEAKTQYKDGMTALHLAAMSGKPEVVYLLLHAGADPLALNRDGKTAAELATDNVTRVACLYGEAQRKAELKLYEAVRRGNYDEAVRMLRAGANPNAEPPGARDAGLLYVAVTKGTAELVKAMLEAGADVRKSAAGENALFAAARYHRADLVDMLVEAGIDPREPDSTQHTASYYASGDTKELLLKAEREK